MTTVDELQQLSAERLSHPSPIEVVDPSEEVTMSVLVRRSLDSLRLSFLEEATDTAAAHRRYLSREDVARMFDADLDYVAQSSRKHGLTVVEANPARRTLVLRGTMKQVVGFAKLEMAGSAA